MFDLLHWYDPCQMKGTYALSNGPVVAVETSRGAQTNFSGLDESMWRFAADGNFR